MVCGIIPIENTKRRNEMRKYKVYVMLREGYRQDVIIEATGALEATYIARAQYGEQNVFGIASAIY
jgi:hypothetical protein